jgi:hypothetical protein
VYLAREVFEVRAGRAGELAKIFKRHNRLPRWRNFKRGKIYTTIRGDSWTVVYEREIRSIDARARDSLGISKDSKPGALFKDYHAIVEGGYRQLYKVEQ